MTARETQRSPEHEPSNPFPRFDLGPVLTERSPGPFDREGRVRDHLYASTLGSCLRSNWFSFREPWSTDEDFSAHRGALGHAVEDLMAEKLAPIIVRNADGREGREVSFTDEKVSGRVDFVVRFMPDQPQIPIELKTTYAFDKSLAQPFDSHVMQLRWYLTQLKGSPFGLLMYYNLSNWGDKAGYWDCLKVGRDDAAVNRRIAKVWAVTHQDKEPECEFPEDDGGLCWACGLRNKKVTRLA